MNRRRISAWLQFGPSQADSTKPRLRFGFPLFLNGLATSNRPHQVAGSPRRRSTKLPSFFAGLSMGRFATVASPLGRHGRCGSLFAVDAVPSFRFRVSPPLNRPPPQWSDRWRAAHFQLVDCCQVTRSARFCCKAAVVLNSVASSNLPCPSAHVHAKSNPGGRWKHSYSKC